MVEVYARQAKLLMEHDTDAVHVQPGGLIEAHPVGLVLPVLGEIALPVAGRLAGAPIWAYRELGGIPDALGFQAGREPAVSFVDALENR